MIRWRRRRSRLNRVVLRTADDQRKLPDSTSALQRRRGARSPGRSCSQQAMARKRTVTASYKLPFAGARRGCTVSPVGLREGL